MYKKNLDTDIAALVDATKLFLNTIEKHQLLVPNEKLKVTRLLSDALERKLSQKSKDEIYEMRSKLISDLDFDWLSDLQDNEIS